MVDFLKILIYNLITENKGGYEFKTEIYEKDNALKHTKPVIKVNMDIMTLTSKKHFVNFMKYTVLGIEIE